MNEDEEDESLPKLMSDIIVSHNESIKQTDNQAVKKFLRYEQFLLCSSMIEMGVSHSRMDDLLGIKQMSEETKRVLRELPQKLYGEGK